MTPAQAEFAARCERARHMWDTPVATEQSTWSVAVYPMRYTCQTWEQWEREQEADDREFESEREYKCNLFETEVDRWENR